MNYYVYMVECSDDTFYTGWTNNIEKRVREHNQGKGGAKYTQGRRPVRLVHVEMCLDLSSALKREYQIKKLSHGEKIQLTRSNESIWFSPYHTTIIFRLTN